MAEELKEGGKTRIVWGRTLFQEPASISLILALILKLEPRASRVNVSANDEVGNHMYTHAHIAKTKILKWKAQAGI